MPYYDPYNSSYGPAPVGRAPTQVPPIDLNTVLLQMLAGQIGLGALQQTQVAAPVSNERPLEQIFCPDHGEKACPICIAKAKGSKPRSRSVKERLGSVSPEPESSSGFHRRERLTFKAKRVRNMDPSGFARKTSSFDDFGRIGSYQRSRSKSPSLNISFTNHKPFRRAHTRSPSPMNRESNYYAAKEFKKRGKSAERTVSFSDGEGGLSRNFAKELFKKRSYQVHHPSIPRKSKRHKIPRNESVYDTTDQSASDEDVQQEHQGQDFLIDSTAVPFERAHNIPAASGMDVDVAADQDYLGDAEDEGDVDDEPENVYDDTSVIQVLADDEMESSEMLESSEFFKLIERHAISRESKSGQASKINTQFVEVDGGFQATLSLFGYRYRGRVYATKKDSRESAAHCAYVKTVKTAQTSSI